MKTRIRYYKLRRRMSLYQKKSKISNVMRTAYREKKCLMYNNQKLKHRKVFIKGTVFLVIARPEGTTGIRTHQSLGRRGSVTSIFVDTINFQNGIGSVFARLPPKYKWSMDIDGAPQHVALDIGFPEDSIVLRAL